jgi:hypothetical protein
MHEVNENMEYEEDYHIEQGSHIYIPSFTDVEGPVGPEEHDPTAVAGNRFLPWTFLLQAQRETSTKRSAGQKCMFLDFHH